MRPSLYDAWHCMWRQNKTIEWKRKRKNAASISRIIHVQRLEMGFELCSRRCSAPFGGVQEAMIKRAHWCIFCSRVQLHLLLQKGRLINPESALFALPVPFPPFHPHNRKQTVLVATDSVSEAQQDFNLHTNVQIKDEAMSLTCQESLKFRVLHRGSYSG